MIAKEMMKRGGILSRLAQFKEESPYKPETTLICVRLRSKFIAALTFAPEEFHYC